MKAKFETPEAFHAAIAAAVMAGLTFDAYERDGEYTIEYTGGY